MKSRVSEFLHGGDYNPDQWLDYPEILKEDVRLMKLAYCNTVSINIFGWSAIEPEEGKYTLLGEMYVHGHNLDWKRFVTYQTIEFYKHEMKPLREITPDVPITTNFMGVYPGLDYWQFAKEVDIVSWDNYPSWHNDYESTEDLAEEISFVHDINRSLKNGQPFLMMESTPSLVNWQPVSKIKRPGVHMLSSMQSVAHGSDSVLYFQWRKGRGASEKFHGAVVDHCGHENTRVFREVTEVGKVLEKIKEIKGSTIKSDVAIIYDWENRWAIDDAQALKKNKKFYEETCKDHYRAFWKKGISVDVINMECDLSKYKVVIAPMLYMIRPGVAERIEEFVKNGGTFVTTYWSGIVNENDLCFLGGFPGPLRKVTGIWSEEIDSLYDSDRNYMNIKEMNGLKSVYEIKDYCDVIHAGTAEVLATYKDDYYK